MFEQGMDLKFLSLLIYESLLEGVSTLNYKYFNQPTLIFSRYFAIMYIFYII